MLEGLPCVSRSTRAIASATSGSTGVVAAWSRYTRSISESLGGSHTQRMQKSATRASVRKRLRSLGRLAYVPRPRKLLSRRAAIELTRGLGRVASQALADDRKAQ